MRPVARPQLRIVDAAYPELGDEESTVMMEEPEPTTLAVRPRFDSPPPPPQPPPAPRLAVAPLPALVPDPQWAAELPPRALATIRVAPLPAAELETTPESAAKPAVGSRRLSALAAVALGVAVWTLGLGHHQSVSTSSVSPSPSPSVVSSVVVAPWGFGLLLQWKP